MAVTKKELIKMIHNEISNSKTHSDMINRIANFIILNFKIKKVIIQKGSTDE